ncbi:MAG TPA: hypothetical protein VJH37_04185 [Candidatus Nanoarchaeia archaeon]|nr:hypothetical protein [Candidatus Nanoarchaeia archaeon]
MKSYKSDTDQPTDVLPLSFLRICLHSRDCNCFFQLAEFTSDSSSPQSSLDCSSDLLA